MLFEILVCFILEYPRCSGSGGAWWMARRVAQCLCSTHGQVQTKDPVSLIISEWVSGDVGGLGETNCDIKDYTPTLPI